MKKETGKKQIDQDDEDKLHLDYLKYTKEYDEKYGKNSIVLIQCGNFFEVYSVVSHETGEYLNTKILEFSEVCQMNIGPKKSVADKNGKVVMAGFQTYLLDKYLPKLLDSGYTVIVYIQEKEQRKDGKYNRVLDKVYSPGTYICCDTDSSPQITNNIMCIWMHLSKPLLTSNSVNLSKIRDTIIYGVPVINIFTGKSSMFESRSPFLMNNTTFDELERNVSVYNPSEVILLSPFDASDIQIIIQYTGIKSQSIHKVDTRDINNQKVSRCENQRYMKQLLTSFYNEETFDLCSEFHENLMATQSFCYLLNFIQEHNPDLVRRISIPTFNNTSDRMILANHTLLQLNIIDDGNHNQGQYSSVSSFLNKCNSSIGKRTLQYQITNPTFDEEWLNNEYEMIDRMLQQYPMVEAFRKLLLRVKDLEKICRQIVLKRIYPASISHLYKTVDVVEQINTCLYELPEITDYLCNDFIDKSSGQSSHSFIEGVCTKLKQYLDQHLIMEVCEKTASMTTFDTNIIQRGVSETLDKACDEYAKCKETFTVIRNYLNDLMQKHEKSSDTEYISMQKKEKSGEYLQITTKRSKVLQSILTGIISKASNAGKITLENDVAIDLAEIRFRSAGTSSTTMDIESTQLSYLNKRMLDLKDKINTFISEAYLKVLADLETSWLDELEKITKYIAKIDVLQCKTYLANQYNYCKPMIDTSAKFAYVNVSEMRHCLIEHIQQNEIYVANDLILGSEDKGILLYGTNAVGKTSLIRAIGVCIIMAQCGMFVPCYQFMFKPYTAIYSRILGNDNIFKGLSTFAVEMSELRIILKMADENSLILGDELCSGTETESALSIFGAGLVELAKKNCSFIFATHFHEILKFDEVKQLTTVVTKHMAVYYDRANDCLVYDRKLKDGSGPRIYGLEVCKSLYLEDEFLDFAYSLRNKYYPETKGTLTSPTSSYNANKLKSALCERCGVNAAQEVHHLQQQKDANEKGFIGSFHKNHPANLENVCEECHDKIHSEKESDSTKKKIVRKKTTKGYKVKEESLIV
jgi:DNA mismatch repair protein MutS